MGYLGAALKPQRGATLRRRSTLIKPGLCRKKVIKPAAKEDRKSASSPPLRHAEQAGCHSFPLVKSLIVLSKYVAGGDAIDIGAAEILSNADNAVERAESIP
jgi:hypothetical protein